MREIFFFSSVNLKKNLEGRVKIFHLPRKSIACNFNLYRKMVFFVSWKTRENRAQWPRNCVIKVKSATWSLSTLNFIFMTWSNDFQFTGWVKRKFKIFKKFLGINGKSLRSAHLIYYIFSSRYAHTSICEQKAEKNFLFKIVREEKNFFLLFPPNDQLNIYSHNERHAQTHW